jgi:hypothetical protein
MKHDGKKLSNVAYIYYILLTWHYLSIKKRKKRKFKFSVYLHIKTTGDFCNIYFILYFRFRLYWEEWITDIQHRYHHRPWPKIFIILNIKKTNILNFFFSVSGKQPPPFISRFHAERKSGLVLKGPTEYRIWLTVEICFSCP